MKQDWVKAIGNKLREDPGDCPTLPKELVDVLDRLEQAHQAGSRNGQTSISKAGGMSSVDLLFLFSVTFPAAAL
jgi:hypothetical protein